MAETPTRRRVVVVHVAQVARYRTQQRLGLIDDTGDTPTMLLRLLDEVIEHLEAEPRLRYFTVDGESYLIEHYLQYRPQHRERVRRLVGAGRLLLGPWYVVPEPTLVNVESLVRNLQLGLQVAREFGPPLMVGYLPDVVGLHSAIPSLFKSFGIDSVIRSNGLAEEPLEQQYRGLDGVKVVVGNLSEDSFSAEDTLTSVYRKLAPHTAIGHLLILSQWQVGTTAATIADWLASLQAATSQLADDVVESSPADYAKALAVAGIAIEFPNAEPPPQLSAEGRMIRDWCVALTRGVLRWLEPFFAWAELAGLRRSEPYLQQPQRLIQQVWKDLLRDQAATPLHDPAQRDKRAARLAYYQARVADLREVPLTALTESIDTSQLPAGHIGAIAIFNSSSTRYRGSFTFQMGWERGDYPTTATLLAYDATGQVVGEGIPQRGASFVNDLHLTVDVPAFGYNTYSIAVGENAMQPQVSSQAQSLTQAPALRRADDDLIGLFTLRHAGTMPRSGSLIAVSAWRFEVTTIKLPADPTRSGMIIRGSNRGDDPLMVTITPFKQFRTCAVVNLDEVPTGAKLPIQPDGSFTFKANGHRLLTFWLHD